MFYYVVAEDVAESKHHGTPVTEYWLGEPFCQTVLSAVN